jgi:hypothetical protein
MKSATGRFINGPNQYPWLGAFTAGLAMPMLSLSMILALAAPAAVSAPVPLQNATATFTQFQFFVGQTIDGNLGGPGVVNGWAIANDNGLGNPETAVFETQTDVGGPGGAALTFTLTQDFGSSLTLGRFRLSVTEDDRTSFADGLDTGGHVTASWFVLSPITALATNGPTLTIQADHSILASGANSTTTVYTVTAATTLTKIAGIRLEALNDASLPDNGPGRHGSSNLVLQEFAVDFVEPALPNANFDENGIVNGADLTRWGANFSTGTAHTQGNADGALSDLDVDGHDFLIWQRQLGSVSAVAASASVPEPRALILTSLIAACLALNGRRGR